MKKLYLIICFAAACCWGAPVLSGEALDVGDVVLSQSVPGTHEFYRLWPENGRRADDPLKDQNEMFDTRIRNVSCPTIMVMRPEQANGKAVLVFPGGGYQYLAARKEGSLVGQWLNEQGITAFVVKYRVPKREGVNVAWQDAQRAIRFVRGNAKQFGINPQALGVMGFSAGGHLSATLVHQFDVASYPPVDELDQLDCKPNFGILIYPAYLSDAGQIASEMSDVKDQTIPLYIAISARDHFVAGTELYVPILRKAKVPFEYHVYPGGGHGVGLAGFPWVKTCEAWLQLQIK